MNYLNLTPHMVRVVDSADQVVLEVPPESIPARVLQTTRDIAVRDGVTLSVASYGDVTGLPKAQPDTLLIVSTIVRDASDRGDLAVPDSGPTAIRRDGHVYAVRRLLVDELMPDTDAEHITATAAVTPETA